MVEGDEGDVQEPRVISINDYSLESVRDAFDRYDPSSPEWANTRFETRRGPLALNPRAANEVRSRLLTRFPLTDDTATSVLFRAIAEIYSGGGNSEDKYIRQLFEALSQRGRTLGDIRELMDHGDRMSLLRTIDGPPIRGQASLGLVGAYFARNVLFGSPSQRR